MMYRFKGASVSVAALSVAMITFGSAQEIKPATGEATKAVNDQLHASERIAQVENSTLLKAMADMISGEIAGVAYHGRAITAGAGTAARY